MYSQPRPTVECTLNVDQLLNVLSIFNSLFRLAKLTKIYQNPFDNTEEKNSSSKLCLNSLIIKALSSICSRFLQFCRQRSRLTQDFILVYSLGLAHKLPTVTSNYLIIIVENRHRIAINNDKTMNN